MGHHKKTTGRFSAIVSTSDTNLAKDPPGGIARRRSDSGSRPEQSSVEERPQRSLGRRFLNTLGLKKKPPISSPLQSPSSGVEPPKVTWDHHIVTSVSPSHHSSPSYHDVQDCAPIIRVSPSPPERTASENPEPSSNCPTNIQTPTCQVRGLGETHTAELQMDPRIIKPPPHSSVVWIQALEIAKKKLSENNLPSLDLTNITSQSAEENIQAVFKSLNALQEDQKKKRWSYTWRGRDIVVVERLGDILRSMEKYSKIVDTVVQYDPQASALIWAGIQGIMRVALNHVEAVEGFEVAIAALLEKISMCEFYSGIYNGVTLPSPSTENSSQLQRMLDSTLPDLYAAVIVFSVKARTYFEAKGIKKATNVLKSFDIEFQPFIEEINTKEGVIRQCADAATMERVRSKYNSTCIIGYNKAKSNANIHTGIEGVLHGIISDLEPLARLHG